MAGEMKKVTEDCEKEYYIDLYREILPHIETIRQKLEERGEKAIMHISVSAGGYLNVGNAKTGWEASRVSMNDGEKIVIRKEVSETLEV